MVIERDFTAIRQGFMHRYEAEFEMLFSTLISATI